MVYCKAAPAVNVKPLSVLARDSKILVNEGSGGDAPKAYYNKRINDLNLFFQPLRARGPLLGQRIAVVRRTAFYDVGYIHTFPVKVDHLGLNAAYPATCFPTASAAANSWDEAMIEQMGRRLGAETRAQRVGVILGPGVNIKRSPLCGRNFEYYSEDPLLAGKCAAALIRGVQSNGIAACVKHFAANSQETLRMTSDSVMDERTLREIYLPAFEIAVKEGRVKCLMTSYNMLNGQYTNENEHLLQDILTHEWDYDGLIVTDGRR